MKLDPARVRAWHALRLGPLWVRRDDGPAAGPPLRAHTAAGADVGRMAAVPSGGAARDAAVAGLNWEALQQAVTACTACALAQTRRHTVFGVGDRQAHWMFIGEAPGAEEDAQGEPFVGQAGKLLDNMLAAIGLSRHAQGARGVYIANVLKCRPPGNRNPEPAEVALCEPFLLRQLELVAPRVLVLMGRFAAQSVLRTDASIASLRGRVHEISIGGRRVPTVVTYHPAYLLRNLADKAKAWADLCLARRAYARAEPVAD
ncbi:MAG: uracil-DNA glycosylase [Sutterellaceae bacterium]|nr:uracil-DNA glycosylase [Burkholderiaceae bacterium]MCX7902337.1 uracil-DNA glycosylase [Burkholderiaceae bacterium]MDW8429342.1 uracil-DNA glycosylase [Sutterellaceae bacterium]